MFCKEHDYKRNYLYTSQALETKLASCRNFVKDPPREKKSAGPNSNSPRFVINKRTVL